MDTDSLFFGLSATKIDDVIKPNLKSEYEANKNNWLAWHKFSIRTPGLFKLEFQVKREIALCSKCYYADEGIVGKSKYSSKGMSQRHNELTWGRYKRALECYKDMAENRGFRMRDGVMMMYTQKNEG